jgi:hypothetical protein
MQSREAIGFQAVTILTGMRPEWFCYFLSVKPTTRNVLLAAGFILVGAVAATSLKPEFAEGRGGWLIVRMMGLLFLANGLYGLVSGRVYGRSWKHYWGGWCHRSEEPSCYWSYTLGHVVIGLLVQFLGR